MLSGPGALSDICGVAQRQSNMSRPLSGPSWDGGSLDARTAGSGERTHVAAAAGSLRTVRSSPELKAVNITGVMTSRLPSSGRLH